MQQATVSRGLREGGRAMQQATVSRGLREGCNKGGTMQALVIDAGLGGGAASSGALDCPHHHVCQ